jgi:hypothetical protein
MESFWELLRVYLMSEVINVISDLFLFKFHFTSLSFSIFYKKQILIINKTKVILCTAEPNTI